MDLKIKTLFLIFGMLQFPFSFLLNMQSSLKNLSYLQTCLFASKKGICTFTFLNVLKISCSSHFKQLNSGAMTLDLSLFPFFGIYFFKYDTNHF